MIYLEGLNDRQKEAVLHTEGPILILAGAGSGKTKVVTNKIAYLIDEKGVDPYNILAITFTNKASSEMKERVEGLIAYDTNKMWMGTFHSIGVRILRRDIDKIGYKNSFTIYDRDDQITLVKECIKEKNLDKDIYPDRMVLSRITDFKADGVNGEDYVKNNYGNLLERNIGELYILYESKLKSYNALDFDDLLIKTVDLLKSNDEIFNYYQRRFRYVFVDEYQDTNRIQYEMIKLLSGGYNNISVVGDSDQSIYSWRGADIRNILDFEKDYKNAKVILLEENYRSTDKILELANKVIRNNSDRKDKNLWTSHKDGKLPIYRKLDNERDEATYIASKIDELVKEGYKLSDIGILYRTNAQSRPFEEGLMSRSIPYKLVGGLKFYDRKEIKDIVAYLRVIENPVDNISLKRIINTPRRGIGAVTIEKLENFAEEKSISIYEALLDLEGIELNKPTKDKLSGFVDLINEFIAKKELMSLRDFIEEVVNNTGYIGELEKENTIEAKTRIENIREFISVAIDFEMSEGESSLDEFLTSISLLSDVDNLEDSDDTVTMMTMHSSKGLEYEVVFLVGMEEGLFPSFRSFDSDKAIEEERRLCYVGITRARKELYITSANYRTIYGKTNSCIPSRFLGEMGDKIEEEVVEKQPLLRTLDYRTEKEISRPAANPTLNLGAFGLNKGAKKSENLDIDFKLGDKVEHGKWGLGTIVQIKDKPGNDQELTIAFETEGLKRLLKSIAPIKPMR